MHYLVIEPHSEIWPHSRATFQLALALLRGGNEVSFLTCGQAMAVHCNVSESRSRTFSKDSPNADCTSCERTTRLIDRKLSNFAGFKSFSSLDLLGARAASTSDFRLFQNADSIRHLKVGEDNCPVGDLAMYETLLKFKLSSDELLAESHRAFHRIYTINAARMNAAATALAQKIRPDAVIAFSPQYASVGSACWPFEARGVPVFFLEGSAALPERYSHLRIWSWSEHGLDNPRLLDFERRSEPISDESRAKDHFDIIRRGASYSVYSKVSRSSVDIRSHFSLGSVSSVALLAMSSSDEVLAATLIGRMGDQRTSKGVFDSQLQWLEATIEWFRDRPDYALVVRPHPRDYPTAREPAHAEHTRAFAKVIAYLPPNVRIDPPEKQIPLWAFFGQVSALVTGWSSTALEALYHRTPVVTYDSRLTPFPADLSFSGVSREQYFANLDLVLRERKSVSLEAFEKFVAWIMHNYFEKTIAIKPRLFEALRVSYRLFDRALNGMERLAPSLIRWIDQLRFTKKASRAIENQLRVFLEIEIPNSSSIKYQEARRALL